jgi:hypothetical protein
MTPLPPRAPSVTKTVKQLPNIQDPTMAIWRRELMVVEAVGLPSMASLMHAVLTKTYPGWSELPWETREDEFREEMQRLEAAVVAINEEIESKDMLELDEDQQQLMDDEAEIHNAEEWMRRHLTEGTDDEPTMEEIGRQETTFEV